MADVREPLRVLSERLGGTVIGGGEPPNAGFRVVHVHVGDPSAPGMTIELIEPHLPEHNDFMARFIARRGPGPHHVTFKVPDVEAELRRIRGLGIEPIGIRFDTPQWREMFLHPRDAHGIVVQIAQPGTERPPPGQRVSEARSAPVEGWWGDAGVRGDGASARIVAVELETPSPNDARRFWCEVLGGSLDGGDVWWSGGRFRFRTGGRPGVHALVVDGIDRPMTVGGTLLLPAG